MADDVKDIDPEDIDGRIVLAVAAAGLLVGIRVLRRCRRKSAARRRRRARDPRHLDDLASRKPKGGRVARRRDPHADGHATPAAGESRISSAPEFYSYK